MSWTTAESDLRTKLSDNATDKHCYRKKIFGELNGVNTRFKTLEFRRLTNFKNDPPGPLGIFLGGVLLTNADIADDNPPTGDFSLAVAPPDDGSSLEGSYYSQWFTIEEIQLFLRSACNWLALGDDYVNIQPGLRPAAMAYASAEAYQKLALRWSQMLSEQYMLNDAVEKDRFAIVEAYQRSAKQYRDAAYKDRDDFYARSGQSNIPYAGSINGSVRDPVPRR